MFTSGESTRAQYMYAGGEHDTQASAHNPNEFSKCFETSFPALAVIGPTSSVRTVEQFVSKRSLDSSVGHRSLDLLNSFLLPGVIAPSRPIDPFHSNRAVGG